MASQFPFKLFGPATRAVMDVNHVLLPVIKILVLRPQTTLRASTAPDNGILPKVFSG
jgi:hypothetical protein